MRENSRLEFKEDLSNTFLKTVCAYANYGDGEIVFGISDSGDYVGIKDTKKLCIDIENLINGNLDPVPEYTLSINSKKGTVILRVMEGMHKPYMYRSKAYIRHDTSTVPVGRMELGRLILEGRNLSFEELKSENQELSFEILKEKLMEELGLNDFTKDTLKTLELYSDSMGYNNAAELLADKNSFHGIDIIRFGESINYIHDRQSFVNISVLDEYDKSVEVYDKYYRYEEIKGTQREEISLIPEAAFREAVANAIVHRTWDVEANISISMFPDKIEIVSPGALPEGISREEYLRGGISILRNPILANVFYRLKMIEKFGTGIRRIREEYKNSVTKPTFELSDNSIKITLPVMKKENGLTKDQNTVYEILKKRDVPSSVVCEETGFGKSKVVDILKTLNELGYVSVSGNGRGTKYTAKE